VLVVDDQAPFRLAARAVLRRLDGFEFAGEAKNGLEAVGLVEALKPALVLMDIHMPEMNGIEATRRIVAVDPAVAVILCSTHDPKDLPADAATSGAIAYVSKEHLSAATIRDLWNARDSGTFTSV
jgi:two-component system, NarL family, invasion response regulator UvrY